MFDPLRDCPHGHQKGKCDSCDLIVAEKRVAELEAKVEALEHRIHEASEVYAGMDGFTPETPQEAYRQRILQKMYDALQGEKC
jgi:hypothetical protein